MLMIALSPSSVAIFLYQQLTFVFVKGEFRLNKWVCNDRSVLSQIPEDYQAKDVKMLGLSREQLPMERALGVQWDDERMPSPSAL